MSTTIQRLSPLEKLAVLDNVAQLKKKAHPASKNLPPDTGSYNPILQVYALADLAVLQYSSPYPYTRSSDRNRHLDPRALPSDTSIFDTLTKCYLERALRSSLPQPQEIEYTARRGFLNWSYFVGITPEGAFGGIKQMQLLKDYRAHGQKVIEAHLFIFPEFRNSGLGTVLLGIYCAWASQSFDGVIFGWEEHEMHRPTRPFFEKNGFETDSYSAIKLFDRRR